MLGLGDARLDLICFFAAIIGISFATLGEYMEEKSAERRARKIIEKENYGRHFQRRGSAK